MADNKGIMVRGLGIGREGVRNGGGRIFCTRWRARSRGL